MLSVVVCLCFISNQLAALIRLTAFATNRNTQRLEEMEQAVQSGDMAIEDVTGISDDTKRR